jgi:glycosyltransferase involved in cell wall biosynthesis
MTRLIYIANMRLPTEKAHGLQIMQNCEAFADAGIEVELWAARRINTPELHAVADPWAYYGVKRNFVIRRVPSLDLMLLATRWGDWLAQPAFYLQMVTFALVMMLRALFSRSDIYYSRDPLELFMLSLIKARRTLAYEAHMLSSGRGGRWLQRRVVRRVGTVIAVTRKLAEDLAARNISSQRGNRNSELPQGFLIAHDGIRRERFANMPSKSDARELLKWPIEAFVVGYVGRLQTMSVDKGVGTLIEALHQVKGATLALVGGPDDIAENLQQQWVRCGLDEAHFVNAGQITPERVPLYLAALDVCVMPFPWTEHFAYYASPMKLFEYMASRRAIIASDLPSTAEVVKHDESALLYPPGDTNGLAGAIIRLRDNPRLRSQLADTAYREVMAHYTWEVRAQAILGKIMSHA